MRPEAARTVAAITKAFAQAEKESEVEPDEFFTLVLSVTISIVARCGIAPLPIFEKLTRVLQGAKLRGMTERIVGEAVTSQVLDSRTLPKS